MKQRRAILFWLKFNSIVWITSIIFTLFGGLVCLTIALGIGIAGLVVSGFWLPTWLESTGLDKDWFETQDELEQLKESASREWNKAIRLSHILGQQESVRLYKEAKQKEKDDAERT